MKCQICNSDKFEHIFNINHKCLDCGHIFIDGPDNLEEYYNNIYRNNNPLPDETIRVKFANNILDKVKSVVDLKDKVILEIGAADGFLSETIAQKFQIDKKQFICCELDKNLADKCAEREFKTWNCNFLHLLNVSIDIVFAIDIIEHLPDMNLVKNWLKRFKYAVIQLPRARGPKLEFRAHFQTFSDKSLEKFLEGFKILGRWDTPEGDTCFGKSYLVVIENTEYKND